MKLARRFVLSGRVQGVGFRWFATDHAEIEGIKGSVRNLPNGDVEVIAEGERDAMERFEMAIRQGPPRAHIEEVRTEILTPSGRYPRFTAH